MILALNSYAYESDQHTVPKAELADVGVDISSFIYGQTKLAVDKLNLDLRELPAKIEETKKRLQSQEALEKPLLRRELKKKLTQDEARLASIQTDAGVVAAVYDELGGTFTWEDQRDGVFGLPLSIIPYPDNKKDNKPITYLPGKLKTIYSFSGFHRIISPSYFVFCSSLKMYGVYLGVDKLGHMFNQGYEYYVLYHKALSEKKSASEAMKAVIDWGEETENGMYGMVVDGVYSNGDLAANFGGFHFYENLLNPITLDDETLTPLLKINEDHSVSFNNERQVAPENLLRPVITDHLNEAINPSHFERPQRKIIKKAIKNRCEGILRFYDIKSAQEIQEKTDSLKSWHGKEYGHRSDELLKIDELCF